MLIRHYQLDVDLGHLSEANEPLTFALKARPTELLPLFEAAVRRHARRLQSTGQPAAATVDPTGGALSTDPEWQVTLRSDANITSIRDIDVSILWSSCSFLFPSLAYTYSSIPSPFLLGILHWEASQGPWHYHCCLLPLIQGHTCSPDV